MSTKHMTIILMIMMMIRAMFVTVTAEISDCRDLVDDYRPATATQQLISLISPIESTIA